MSTSFFFYFLKLTIAQFNESNDVRIHDTCNYKQYTFFMYQKFL